MDPTPIQIIEAAYADALQEAAMIAYRQGETHDACAECCNSIGDAIVKLMQEQT